MSHEILPPHPLAFDIGGVDLVTRPHGRQLVAAYGDGPALESLIDWTLVVFVRSGRLVFAGVHRSLAFRDHPYVEFLALDGLTPASLGTVDAGRGVDLCLMDDEGRIVENYVFTYTDAASLDVRPQDRAATAA